MERTVFVALPSPRLNQKIQAPVCVSKPVLFYWYDATAQGRRIFGIIAGGGTFGSMVGSQIAARLVGVIGVANLLLIPAVLLVAALLVYFSMENSFRSFSPKTEQSEGAGKATGGNLLAGFTAMFKSKYLFSIFLFTVFLATCATSVYFQQSEIADAAFADAPYDASLIKDADSLDPDQLADEHEKLQKAASSQARTQYFANVDSVVSCVTLVFQFVVVGWLMKKVGLGFTLGRFR